MDICNLHFEFLNTMANIRDYVGILLDKHI